jgi:chaperone modulatory protein CbpM
MIKMTDTKLTICFDELCDLAYVEPDWIIEIIDYGIATPISGSNKNDWFFDTSSVVWLKKAIRIYIELELDWVAVGMIIELLKENQVLSEENQFLTQRLHRFYDRNHYY